MLPAGRYFARIFAINEFGVGVASQEHEIVVRENGASPPTAPVNVQALVSGGVLMVMWDPPIGGNAPDGYVLEAGSAPGLSRATLPAKPVPPRSGPPAERSDPSEARVLR